MPPKISITEQHILEAAFEIVRTRGTDALTARTLADALGCSTQPIYRAFGSMENVQGAVTTRALSVAMGYLFDAKTDEEIPFLGFGYGSLRFAQKEPHLHRLVTGVQRAEKTFHQGLELPPYILAEMSKNPMLAALDEEQLTRIFRLLWFFCLGISSVFEADTDEDPMPMAREYLAMASDAVIRREIERSKP